MIPVVKRGFVVVAAGLMLASGANAQDEIVARGNQAYQDEDYSAAIDAYEAVLEAGFRSSGLEYNLGNAYFKTGALGRSILHWERARRLSPDDEDVRANLELARSLTADAVEPLPRFWLLSALSWWLRLLPRAFLVGAVPVGWLALTGGAVTRILSSGGRAHGLARCLIGAGTVVLVVLGSTLLARELEIGEPERAIVMVEVVPVRSAPAADDDLTLFEIHEGTRVRLDQSTGTWAEVVLDDGKVGWIPLDSVEII